MYSFIPSWYGDRGDWQGSILPWHETGHSYEFDDTVNHLRMFRDAGEETEILCLGWSPRLRRFLHRQSLDRISCWSVFDELQGITLQKPAVFSYLELPWPEDTEWVYICRCIWRLTSGISTMRMWNSPETERCAGWTIMRMGLLHAGMSMMTAAFAHRPYSIGTQSCCGRSTTTRTGACGLLRKPL